MRVVFIEVDTERSWAVAAIGPGYIGAYLRAHGHQVDFVRASVDAGAGEIAADLDRMEPDLIGVSITTRQWLRARALVREIRSRVDVPLVAGGLHPTSLPAAVLCHPGFDYVCLGEGEEAMLDLVTALESGVEPDGIANIWRRGGGRPGLRPVVANLDDLPFIARDLLDEQFGVAHVNTQRGCPFPCTYCAARMFDQLYEGVARYGRRRSVENVLQELKLLQSQEKLSYASFLDDTFTLQREWVMEFCRLHREQIGVPFFVRGRVETVDEELLDALARAGCSQIEYGVESGSERVRREIMRRPVGNERIRDVFRWTREAGIPATANYMLGLPGETRAELEQTLELAEELPVLDLACFVFYPYPGTALYGLCRERGYLPENHLERPANHRESILELPDLSGQDISEIFDRFTGLRQRLYASRARESGLADVDPWALEHIEETARSG